MLFVRYNIAYDRWESLEPMPDRLADCVAVSIDDKVYIAGGCTYIPHTTTRIYNSNAIYRCRPDDRLPLNWKKLTYFNEPLRTNVILAKLGKVLYMIFNNASLCTFDTITCVWTKVCRFVHQDKFEQKLFFN